ncbi:MAG: WD domain, G-beta repeat [Candidatus Dependentiae bacterium ADurb.Bin331]|nr:MAG: WD domain, G-beta repeat [Candidatus Dependentiae bacterium ADurb.Bin331]
MKQALFFYCLSIVATSACMNEHFHRSLKASSETIQSLCDDLNDVNISTESIFDNEKNAQLLNCYVTTIEQYPEKKNELQKQLVNYLNKESIQNLQTITNLADYWNIPKLLPLAINAVALKLSSDEQINFFEKNPENYLNNLQLPRTILPIVSRILLEKSPLKNDLVTRELKNKTVPLFSLPSCQAKQYITNNDETLIAFSHDKQIKIVDLQTNKEAVIYNSPFDSLVPCSFTKKNSSIICRTFADGLCIIPLSSPTQLVEINEPISLFDTSTDERFLAAKSQRSGTLYCCDLTTGNQLISHEIPGNVTITTIKIDPTSKFIATGHANGVIYYWKPELGKPHKFVNHVGAVNDIDFNCNGSRMASAGQDQALCIWNLETGTLDNRVTEAAPIKSISFNPVNDSLGVINQNTTATLYDQTLKKIKTIAKSKQTNRSLSGSPQMRWSKKGDVLTYVHKTLYLQIIGLVKKDEQFSAHSIFNGLPITTPSSSSHIRLSNHGSHAVIYHKDTFKTHCLLDLSQVPLLRNKITQSPSISQALALLLWYKNPQLFNQRPEMRTLVETIDPLIKKHLDINEQ